MDRLNERIAAAAALLAALLAVLDLAVGAVTGLRTPAALAPLLFAASAVAALVAARFHLERRSLEERQDAALARVERPDSALFATDTEAGDPLSVARARVQFEAVVVRAAPPVLAIGMGLAAAGLYRRLAGIAPAVSGRLGAASLLAAQAFLLFLSGRYLIGLARDPVRRLLRGPGALLGLGAFAALLAAAAGIAGHAGWAPADRVAASVLAAALAVLAVEQALGFLADLYRPRRRDEAPRTAYESRLARLAAEPAGWIGDAAKSLDYQFGFKVSETWFYRFLRGAVAPLALFQVLILYLLSSVVILAPHEEAVIERLGRPRDAAAGGWRLEPGLHLKWPWPFETVRRFPARRLQTFYVGFRHDAARPRPSTMLWTQPHYAEEDAFLLASAEAVVPAVAVPGDAAGREAAAPVNLLSFNIPIEYRISDLRRYAYGFSDPAAVLERLAYRTLTRALAARDLSHVLGPERMETARALRADLQAEADRLGLGVEIAFVGLHGVHPPVPVADAFEDVVGALEQREASILEARAYRHRRLPVAEAEARRVVFEAEAYRARRTLTAEAEAEQFVRRKAAADLAPAVFRNWYYLQTVREALRGARVYLVAADPGSEVIQFNFEEETPASLLDLSPLMEKR